MRALLGAAADPDASRTTACPPCAWPSAPTTPPSRPRRPAAARTRTSPCWTVRRPSRGPSRAAHRRLPGPCTERTSRRSPKRNSGTARVGPAPAPQGRHDPYEDALEPRLAHIEIRTDAATLAEELVAYDLAHGTSTRPPRATGDRDRDAARAYLRREWVAYRESAVRLPHRSQGW
ncbi:hypothetical protein [Streptomyces sp. NPDC001594]|uniref:hypothetical protein n=1 Tax=Streptomyces sp. NPDC001594 TaxID=3364590 RepID=UPI00369A80A9